MLPEALVSKPQGGTVEEPSRSTDELFSLVRSDPSSQYDVRHLIEAIVDGGRFDEYRAEYGKTLCCGFARLGGRALGIVANQRLRFRTEGRGPYQFGGVIYADSADKAARFVLDCNQSRIPLLFIQDVNGFDVVEELRRHAATAHIPIMVLTAMTLTSEERHKLNGHVTAVVAKTELELEHFRSEVRRAMSGRKKGN